ncbi:MAG: hypothetical protein ABI583_02540 [Betaproteobacteria bacterium]
MASIKIQDVADKLDYELRRAFAAAVEEVIPAAKFDEYELFRAFRRAVGRKCKSWETVPDHLVEKYVQ